MNKCQLFVFLVLATVVSSIEPQNKLREGIIKIIENWRQGSGSLPIAIKPLPLKFPSVSRIYDGYTITMQNLQINGLENMRVVALSAIERVQSMAVTVVVNVPTVTIQTGGANFKQNDGWFSGLFTDSGVLSGQIDNLRACAVLEIGLQGSSAVVNNLWLDFSMDSVTVYVYGATFGYTNQKLREKVSEIVGTKDYGFIRNEVIVAVNNYLRGQTPDQLIAKIKAYA